MTLVAAIVLSVTLQSPATDRDRAEQLARSGQTLEALALFEQILAQHPADADVRQWIARLQLRIGRTEEAEAGFRAVLLDHPSDVDARIGLGAALTRRGASTEALTVLLGAEKDAGENGDLFAALARAYRRAGEDRRALEYFERAKALAPGDPDVIDGYEATAHAYGNSIAFEGFAEGGATDTRAFSVVGTVRAQRRLRLDGILRMQRRAGLSDMLGGGGALWHLNPSTNLEVRAVGGSGNTSLPTSDLAGWVFHYAGPFEIGGSLRGLSFIGADAIAASPQLAWDTGRWRLDTRYTLSRTSFDIAGDASVDHSVMLRETWRGWRRVDINVAYAYGIESFEDLTADRLGSLGATTIGTGVRIRVPSLTVVSTTWEHQWRSNDTTIDRLTVSLVQAFR